MYDYHFFNKTHDLRILFASMFRNTNRIKKDYKLYLRFIIVRILSSITFYYEVEENPFFWDTYSQLVKYYDETFLPENIIAICDYLLEKKELMLNKDKITERQYHNLIDKVNEIIKWPIGPLIKSTIIKKVNVTKKNLFRMNITQQKSSKLTTDINRVIGSIDKIIYGD